MSETRTFTNSDLRSAVAVAVRRDRDRIVAIAALPEAKGREGLALTLATTTDMSVDQAKAALAAAPPAAAARTGAGDRTGDNSASPSTEQPTGEAESADGASSLWDRSLASRGMKIGGK